MQKNKTKQKHCDIHSSVPEMIVKPMQLPLLARIPVM